MDSLIAQLSRSVADARSLEGLTRPLLEMLAAVTGLESTYLTTVDLAAGQQRVVYARNAQDLQIPEGLTLPWGDPVAAPDLGVQTHVSTPVRTDDGALYGTLCAASSQRRPTAPEAEQVLRLFAGLIEQQVARERLAEQLQQTHGELRKQAMTDPLTGLMNRRALMQELVRLMSLAQRTGSWLLAGAIDLDDFKQVNDSHGHDAGDDFLRAMAARLHAALRGGDVLARMGGDEFVVIGLGPQLAEDGRKAAQLMCQRLTEATAGRYGVGPASIEYDGASVGVACLDPQQASIEDVLRQSDSAMYRVKLERRRAAQQ
ncbi:sensor domain-containing diguanylate cyclase [Roseateles sp.]|uniref:GGDEF domain-containing protein n=1 Tax=Roseateles sp. TaxID=1971397 RepID=UPI003265CF28